ncbi:MAG: hypothetical protein WCY32_12285 [Burkholderiaceae bacterium]
MHSGQLGYVDDRTGKLPARYAGALKARPLVSAHLTRRRDTREV